MIIRTINNIEWLPNGKVTLSRSDFFPPLHLVTSVHAFAFNGDKLLFVKNKGRDWEIPGGHIEGGEEIEDALQRELMEEAGVRIEKIRPFIIFEIEAQSPKPKGYKYPHPRSYMVFCLATIGELAQFRENAECIDWQLADRKQCQEIKWATEWSDIVDMAFQEGSSS